MLRSGIIVLMFLFSLSSSAQYNIKKLLEEGKQQLNQGYYVTSMQIGMRIVSLKPQLYEAWYMMAKAKYHLEDFKGAEEDSKQALKLQPYIADIYDLYAMTCIKEEKYDSAIVAYTKALVLDKTNRDYLFNRAFCYYQIGKNAEAKRELSKIIMRWKNFSEAKDLLDDINNNRLPKKKKEYHQKIFLPFIKSAPNLNSKISIELK